MSSISCASASSCAPLMRFSMRYFDRCCFKSARNAQEPAKIAARTWVGFLFLYQHRYICKKGEKKKNFKNAKIKKKKKKKKLWGQSKMRKYYIRSINNNNKMLRGESNMRKCDIFDIDPRIIVPK
jgi:hypothetical protein